MRCMITTTIMMGLFICSSQGTAAEPDAQPVQLEQSAYHLPVFKNEYVTVLNVNMPPGRGSDFHYHNRDQISVYLADYPKEARGRNLGGPIVTIRPSGNGPYAGDVSYNAYYTKPVVNLGINDNKEDKHMYMLATVLNSPKPYGFVPQTREVAGYTQVLDNDRVRGWRLVLQPGETAPAITQQAPGLRVVVRGGDIAEIAAGKRDRGMWLKSGDFFWQEPGATRSVKNNGKNPVEIVEFEFK